MQEQTHTVPVDGIGAFTFKRRMMRDEFKISSEYSRLTEGVDKPAPWLDQFASAFATLKVLTVESPDGWDLDALDPLDDESYRKIMGVFGSLRAAEERFRQPGKATGQGSGAGAGGDDGVVVPPEVQPGAN